MCVSCRTNIPQTIRINIQKRLNDKLFECFLFISNHTPPLHRHHLSHIGIQWNPIHNCWCVLTSICAHVLNIYKVIDIHNSMPIVMTCGWKVYHLFSGFSLLFMPWLICVCFRRFLLLFFFLVLILHFGYHIYEYILWKTVKNYI